MTRKVFRNRVMGVMLAGVIGLCIPSLGSAAPITFDFTGTFVAAEPHSLGGILTGPTGPFPASTISGSFTFESSTVDTNASSTLGHYGGAIKTLSFSVTNIFGGPYQFALTSGGALNAIDINASPTIANQSYILSSTVHNVVPNGPIVDGDNYNARDFFINLIKPTSSVFASDALPGTPPSLSPFSLYNNAALQLDGQFKLVLQSSHGDHTLIGNLTSLTLATVPVPAAAWLFASGLIGLVGVARRRITV